MIICQIMGGDDEGGLEKHFVEMCNSMGVQHKVIAIAHEKYRNRFSSRVVFEALDLTKSRRNIFILFRLYRMLKQYHPDIIHAQANKAASMVATIKPFIKSHYVATVHNIKKKTAMFTSFDRVIAVSHDVSRRISNKGVRVVYNGITCDHERNTVVAKIDLPNPGLPVVVSVGRLVEAKGFDVLLEAWVGINANLVIVGDGPLRTNLETIIESNKLQNKVLMLGHRDDVAALLAMADIIVIASRNEGFPYVMVEALHEKKIIVSSKVPGAVDILPSDCLFECESQNALSERVNWVLKNIEQVKNSYLPVWEMAKSDLTVDGMVRNTLSVYDELLNNESGGSE